MCLRGPEYDIASLYGQLLLFCDQSMREKARCSRKRVAPASSPAVPMASQAFERMHIFWRERG